MAYLQNFAGKYWKKCSYFWKLSNFTLDFRFLNLSKENILDQKLKIRNKQNRIETNDFG